MRRHAFLLLALFAIAARAATIPDAPQTEKKINVLPENTDKTPENVSSEQELIDQSNTINDVDNKLRTKPDVIPVEVVVEDVQPALKTNEEKKDSEEVDRQPIDLKNPGPPQRQEHETQNHEFNAAEQQIVQVYKQNINEAQAVLKQGFQGVSDSIRNLFDNNEQIKSIQQSIQNLREDFINQINKLNGTIQSYLNTESTDPASPVEQQTKAGLQQVEYGLNALKNDFTKGVKTLADGVEVFSYLRADNQIVKQEPTTGNTPANPQPVAPGNVILEMVNRFQVNVQNTFRNLTQSVTNFVNPQNQASNQQTAVPAGAQADTPAATPTQTQPGFWNNFPTLPNFPNIFNINQNTQQDSVQQPGSGSPGPFQQLLQSWQNQMTQLFNGQGAQGSQPAPAAQSAQPTPAKPENPAPVQPAEQKPEPQPEKKPEEKPAEASQATAVTPLGPIRQILQNNPISQGIANAVQRLQNANNPEKPREPVKDNEVAAAEDKPKGHRPAESDCVVSGVESSEPAKEVQKEPVPEVQEPMKEEVKEQTEQVVEKTE